MIIVYKMNTNHELRSGLKWTVNECLRLEREYDLLKLSVEEIALLHQRSPYAIMYKLDAEGIADFNELYQQTYPNKASNKASNKAKEESDDESESESESESEDDESDEELADLEKDLEEDLVGDKDNIKSINISIDLGDDIDLNIEEEVIESDIIPNTKTINLSEDISSFEITSKSLENINDIDIGIKLTNDYADMTETNKEKTDYKKLSINKLRDIVIEKGIVVDASKLKKNDILKMLGAEQ